MRTDGDVVKPPTKQSGPRIGACLLLQYSGGYRDYVEMAVEYQLGWVEFKFDPPFLFEEHLAELEPGRIRELGERHDIGFSMHAPYYELNIGSLNAAIREASVRETLRSVELAARLGCCQLTIHGGDLSKELGRDFLPLAVSHTLQSLRRIKQACDRAGIILCLENRNGAGQGRVKPGVLPDELVAMCRQVGPDVGVTIDLGHANVSGLTPLEFVAAVGPERIRLMHVHDNHGVSDEHLPVGKGTIDFRALAGRYIEMEWAFPLAVECKRLEDVLSSVEALRHLFAEAGKRDPR